MTELEREKLYEIRCRAKQGATLTEDEFQFCSNMFYHHPREYAAMNDEIFQATKPFGSR